LGNIEVLPAETIPSVSENTIKIGEFWKELIAGYYPNFPEMNRHPRNGVNSTK
jgi:hypothetical protein